MLLQLLFLHSRLPLSDRQAQGGPSVLLLVALSTPGLLLILEGNNTVTLPASRFCPLAPGLNNRIASPVKMAAGETLMLVLYS